MPLVKLTVVQIQGIIEGNMFFERTLSFKSSSGTEKLITVRIGTPYFPAKTAGFEMFYGCPVQLDFITSAHEAFGIDCMQALGGALSMVHIYLRDLSNGGELRWMDGRLYNHEHECPIPLEKQINIARSKADIKFEEP